MKKLILFLSVVLLAAACSEKTEYVTPVATFNNQVSQGKFKISLTSCAYTSGTIQGHISPADTSIHQLYQMVNGESVLVSNVDKFGAFKGTVTLVDNQTECALNKNGYKGVVIGSIDLK
ncbi:MAG: hypothetical protein Q8867_08135 [Bacteroidota bacterium]|nr:hypothetical protein [Bacteroidota bacterium]